MKEYALIGHPVGHSMSADFFNEKFRVEHIDARYTLIDLPNLKGLRKQFLLHPFLAGFNVTSPHKVAIMSRLNEIDEEARYVGAVNTVTIRRGFFGRHILKGYNTDVEGFMQSIEPLLQSWHKKALILGTGGGALAVERACRKMAIESRMASRRIGYKDTIGYDKITPEVMAEYKIIVNTTPVGMTPHVLVAPQIPYEAITPEHLCYDLIYTPEETRFLRLAKEQGATVKNGLDMLLIQANEAWKIWEQA